jgi:DNA-binding CsgD family transcriptional regulator
MPYAGDILSSLIGRIYDCAVQPELWPQTLAEIRKAFDVAHLQVVSVDGERLLQGEAAQPKAFRTLFEQNWIKDLAPHFKNIPGVNNWIQADIDTPTSQMQFVSEEDFKRSEFYSKWSKPRGLGDSCVTTLVKRDHLICALTATGAPDRHLFNEEDYAAFRTLSPHIRRALMIGDVIDDGEYKLSLYREILDRIATSVMIVSPGARLVYANGSAEALLSEGKNIKVRGGQLQGAYAAYSGSLKIALDRACSENDIDIGTFGNGIPLPGTDAEAPTAVCYVLPLGKSDHRRALGPGHAAVFVGKPGSSVPPSLEVLSALSGLTTREARIALKIADGSTPTQAADELGVTMNTMRTHLSHIFDKTGVNSQPGLVRYVANLSMPLSVGLAH